MLFVVLFAHVVIIVDLFLSFLVMIFLQQVGVMVLFYIRVTSYYPVRSGSSNGGNYCGVFCVLAHNAASGTYWGIGAALSLLHIILVVADVMILVMVVVHSLLMVILKIICMVGVFVLL